MPPAAALECERTGWTLDMIATVAPALAAASAARWPARPAPMMRTSWVGTGGPVYSGRRSGRREPRLQGAGDLLERHDAAQAPVGVDGHERALAAQGLAREQRLERRVVAHAARLGADHVADRHLAGLLVRGVLDRRPVGQPGEAPVALHDGEPRPALVTQEE